MIRNIKKIKIILIVTLIAMILCSPFKASARVKTYLRTSENPLVPQDVVVTDENIYKILQTPAVNSRDKLYDFEDVLTEKEEENLKKQIQEYIDYTGFDIAIVIAKKIEGLDIAEYTHNFYEYNDFADQGIVLVIYVDKAYTMNAEIEGRENSEILSIYTESRVRQALKEISGDIQKKSYKAISNYIQILQGFYNLEKNGSYNDGPKTNNYNRDLSWFEITLISFSITFVIILALMYIIKKKNKIKYKEDLNDNINDATLTIKTESDDFVGTTLSNKK